MKWAGRCAGGASRGGPGGRSPPPSPASPVLRNGISTEANRSTEATTTETETTEPSTSLRDPCIAAEGLPK
eukprot:1934036-Alexandrium_andersonii.AAC.1